MALSRTFSLPEETVTAPAAEDVFAALTFVAGSNIAPAIITLKTKDMAFLIIITSFSWVFAYMLCEYTTARGE